MAIKLISIPELEKCENIHLLLSLGQPASKVWLDIDWYSPFVKKFITDTISLKIFRTENGDLIPISDGKVPILESDYVDKIEKLWNLLYVYSPYSDKLPAKSISKEWAGILDKWKSLDIRFNNHVTLDMFAQEIEDCKSTVGFKSKLIDSADEFATLNEFYDLLNDTKNQGLFDNKRILPNQTCLFLIKPELQKDNQIEEELKDITTLLGNNIRNGLLHSKISETIQESLSQKQQSHVLDQVMSSILAKGKTPDYLQANIRLLNWLTEHDDLKRLDGYPLQSSVEEKFVSISQSEKEKPLGPKEMWPESAKNYSGLFPEELVISSIYLTDSSKRTNWEKLHKEGFVLNTPLFVEDARISSDEMDSLIIQGEKLDEDKTHEVLDLIPVSKIAFIKTPESKGIMDTIRKTKEKNRKFLNFVFHYVLENDDHWNTPIEVNCKCEKRHKIVPALWLDPIKRRQWVYERKDKSERPSAYTLSEIVSGEEELLKSCRQDKPSKLLNFLRISISELLIHAISTDEQTKMAMERAMGSLYATCMNNPQGISDIAKLAETDPQFITDVTRRLSERELIHKNQELGALVETLFRTALETEGFTVVRTGVGSDFSVENDITENDREVLFEIQKNGGAILFIEVKATRIDSAKMTVAQAREARDNPGNHILCVVELIESNPTLEDVKSGARFVADIGTRLHDKVSELDNFQIQQQVIANDGDIEIELIDGPVRFKVNKPVWSSSMTFIQFVDWLKKFQRPN